MTPDRPDIFLDYKGGNSQPHTSPNKKQGWGEFFKAQTLAEKKVGGGFRQVVMKTSEISPTGVMVIEAANENARQYRNIGSLPYEKASGHLKLVGKVMRELDEIEPDAAVRLWHINATHSMPFKNPSDFGRDRRELHLGIPKKNSQTVGTLHSHCDALDDSGFIEIHSLRQLAQEHEERYPDEDGKSFANERRRLIKPRVFHRFVGEIWKSELKPKLLAQFPNLFEEVRQEEFDQLPPLPTASLALKGGFKAFDQPEFAQAIQFVHKEVAERWKNIATSLQEIAKAKKLDNPSKVENLIEAFIQKHPWSNQFRERLLSLARVIQPDRRKVRDKNNWLHRQFNFTQGVVQWNGRQAVFFINPTPDSNAGVESIGLHSVRIPHELSYEELLERNEFRADLTERLNDIHNLHIGPEGRHTLKQ